MDADIRLKPNALASLLKARELSKGVISVVPFHHTEKLFEKLALIMNMLGIFTFTSVFEKNNAKKGLYGSCILALRQDYEKVNGHQSIRSEVLDDLSLGEKFIAAGVPIRNFIGYGLVSFRMYPKGIKSEIEGFSKGAVLSTSTISPRTIIPIALWVIGLIISETVFIFANTTWFMPLLIGYLLYMFQLFLFYKICRCIWHRYSCISRGGNCFLYLDHAVFDLSGCFSEACKLERKAYPGGRP